MTVKSKADQMQKIAENDKGARRDVNYVREFD